MWWQKRNSWSYKQTQLTGTKGILDQARLGGKGNPLEIAQDIKINDKSNKKAKWLQLQEQNFKKLGKTTLVSRVFANGPGDLGPIPGRVIPKT